MEYNSYKNMEKKLTPKIDRKLEPKQLIYDISSWIKEYCEINNIKSLLIGVSGGIDSALVSTLAAITGLKTYCLILPLYQNPEQTIRGVNHTKWLTSRYDNVEVITIDLSETFKSFTNTLSSNLQNELALVNSKSRLRMLTIYQVAQCKNGIVIGTGNKVEDFGVGFYTKYGDGGVDISPIADLYKSEVYQLTKELGVINEIQTSIPTDGLWGDDRDDETQLGATYDELEWVMEHITYGNVGKDINKDGLTEREIEIIDIYLSFNRINKHKMVDIPVFKIK